MKTMTRTMHQLMMRTMTVHHLVYHPQKGGLSEADFEKMPDDASRRDQSHHQRESDSVEVHPSETPLPLESIRADGEEEADRPKSSGPKPKDGEYRKDPLFDVFIDYDLDPNVMPNGKPTL